MATELGKAYVQIIPSADGIKSQLESILGDNMPNGSKTGKKLGNSITSGFSSAVKSMGSIVSSTLATAAKVGTAALSVASVGVGALVKQSTEAYAAYEQNVGGVETLFKANSDTIIKYANEAYKTAGLSANAYMENVTSFSASLLQGLGGDTAKASEIANTAMVDMSDNANKFGTDATAIQNAYQGFAKQNYTMLDNLKLGYGGTQAEMARLINDSGVMGDGFTATAKNINSVSFDKIIEAIHTVQDDMGIAGTTSLEAGTTISGSFGMVKGAWDNLMAGMADKNADMSGLIGNLVDSVSVAGKNLMPVITQSLDGVVALIGELAPQIIDEIPDIMSQILPSLLDASTQIVGSLCTALPQILLTLVTAVQQQFPTIVNGISEILPTLQLGISSLITEVIKMLPILLPTLVDGACKLFVGIIEALDLIVTQLTPMLPNMIDKIVAVLIDNMPTLVGGALDLFFGIVDGLGKAMPNILQGIVDLVAGIAGELILHIPDLVVAGGELIKGLALGLCDVFEPISSALSEVWTGIGDFFSGMWDSAKQWGVDLIDNFISGIESCWNSVVDTFCDLGATIADYIGFSEPEKGPLSNFHTYAPDMMELFAEGIDENEGVITNQFTKSLTPIMNTELTPANSDDNSGDNGNKSITLVLTDSAGNVIAQTVANPLDIINGNSVSFANRGLAT